METPDRRVIATAGVTFSLKFIFATVSGERVVKVAYQNLESIVKRLVSLFTTAKHDIV